MTDAHRLGRQLDDRSDDELVAAARRGETAPAFAELYRRHAGSARRVARHILRSRHDADDVVNEAFAGVMAALAKGAGPRSNFRLYLMACVRNGCRARRGRPAARASSADSTAAAQQPVIFEDPDRIAESSLVAEAFSALSVPWQRALWMTAVEDRPTADVAARLGQRPAAVAAMAHRAREAFAEEYLARHRSSAIGPACERVGAKLAQFVRGRSSELDALRIEQHLTTCVACSLAVEELRDVNSSLRSLTMPAAISAAATSSGPVAAATVDTVATFGAGAGAGVGGLVVAKATFVAALVLSAAALSARVAPHTATADPATAAAASDAPRAAAEFPTKSKSAAPVTTAATRAAPTTTTATVTTGDPVAPIVPVAGAVDGPDDTVAVTVSPLPPATTPVVTVPTIALPSVTIQVATTPAFVLPPVTIPALTIPPATLPPVSLPPVTLPRATLPTVTFPTVALPSVTLPPVTLPPLTLPPLIAPPVTIPALTIPVVTVSSVSVPSVTLPPASLSGWPP